MWVDGCALVRFPDGWAARRYLPQPPGSQARQSIHRALRQQQGGVCTLYKRESDTATCPTQFLFLKPVWDKTLRRCVFRSAPCGWTSSGGGAAAGLLESVLLGVGGVVGCECPVVFPGNLAWVLTGHPHQRALYTRTCRPLRNYPLRPPVW